MTSSARHAARPVDHSSLAARLECDVITAQDPRWDDARTGWILNADQRPAAVVPVKGPSDIAAVIRYARTNGFRVAAQGTGHSATTLAPNLEQTILIRTGALDRVTVDPVAGTARAEAGAVWSQVSQLAAEHGLAALAGSSPDVGVTGYTLGGGLSWLGRKYGLATNSVVAAEVVTGDGQVLRIDAEHHPELFWAIRGGGGSMAVVTALEFRLYPVAEVYAGTLFWPMERAREVLGAWQAWTQDAPEEVTSCGRLLSLPPLPVIPEPLRGGNFAVLEFAFLGNSHDGDELIAPLRALGPVMDTVTTIPAAELAKMHMDPEFPVPAIGDGFQLREFPPEALDALLAVAGAGTDSPLLSVELRHVGGALGRAARDAGALATMPGAYAGFAVALTMDRAAEQAALTRIRAIQDAVAPWRSELSYPNFAEHPDHPAAFFCAEDEQRLARAKTRYDEASTLVSGHPVRTTRAA
ncbi:MAG TPA: FAD-binding oxidoreductase [Jatrophihabitantaceae bacterium]